MAEISIRALLDMARIHQQSGFLSTTRFQGKQQEDGEIYILAGQPVYAHTGYLLGSRALDCLLTWQHVSFSFATNALMPPANIAPTLQTGSITRSLNAPSPAFPVPRRSTPGVWQLVPRKRQPPPNILSFSLTRRQRLLYFMIDGRLTVGDLARCLNRSEREIELLLSELLEQELVTV